MDTTDYIEQEGNNFEEAEKQISRKVFTRRIDVGDAGPHYVGVFARSPATPLINTEHPSILNERVLHRSPSASRPRTLTLLRYPSVSRLSCAPVTMLWNRGAGERRTAGRRNGKGWGCFETTVSTVLQPRGDLKGEPS